VIWIRRFLANILISVVIVLFMAFLVVGRVNATLGNPDFYIDQLRKADMYNFIYDKALPTAIDELDSEVKLDDTTFELSPRVKAAIVSAARQALPPAWIQARVEDTLSEVLPYLTGDTEEFSVTVPLKDRVAGLGEALKDTLHDEEVFNELYNSAVEYAVDQGMEGLKGAPFDLGLSREELTSAIETLVSKDWLIEQFDGAVDEIVPYLTGDEEHFAIRLELKSRVDAAVDVAKQLLARPETYDYLFDEVVAPVVTEQLGSTIRLPYGITVTQDEVVDAVREVLPQAWLERRLGEIMDEAALYLKGDSDTFEVVVPLADRKAAALEVVGELADRKAEEVMASLPACSLAEAQDIVQNPPPFGQLPPCRPTGITYQQLKGLLGIDLGPAIDGLIGVPIPDEFRFTLADLQQVAGEGNVDVLDTAREYVSEGWTYTDTDMREALDEEAEERLDEVRGWIMDGFTFTEEDLREWMEGGGGPFSEPQGMDTPEWGKVRFALAEEEFRGESLAYQKDVLDDIDTVRGWLGLGRKWFSIAGWGIIAILAVLIGFLGGRNWPSRLMWAAAPLLLASVIAYALYGPVYAMVASPRLHQFILDQVHQAGDVPQVFTDKAVTVATNLMDTFMAGIANQALVVLVVTGLVVVGAIVVPIYLRRRKATG